MTILIDLPRDVRYAAHSLLRTPGFTVVAVAVAVAVLALGTGATCGDYQSRGGFACGGLTP